LFHAEFPRLQRLRGKHNFALFSRAKHHYGVLIRAAVVIREGQKAAFVVSKKVARSAVKRNRLKRRLRELYRKCSNLLPQNVWIMFIALPVAANANFTSLQKDFDMLCRKITSKNTGSVRN
jgi:ribonuclease P protein component